MTNFCQTCKHFESRTISAGDWNDSDYYCHQPSQVKTDFITGVVSPASPYNVRGGKADCSLWEARARFLPGWIYGLLKKGSK